MKIDILCTDGSPIGVSSDTLWGDKHRIGVGGSEYALLTMCEAWAGRGDTVTLFNSPQNVPSDQKFMQAPVAAFNPRDNRDVLIVFRTPNPKAISARGLKVWWSCDQYTSVNFFRFKDVPDRIVGISQFHKQYFEQTYQIKNMTVIDLPVRFHDFPNNVERKPGKFIFTSIPDRGLLNLYRIWGELSEKLPDIELVITSDYRLWGASSNVERHRMAWRDVKNARFIGAVNRATLLQELASSDIFIYPCSYDELFCLACAEAGSIGAYPVTNNRAALATTNMGTVLGLRAESPNSDKIFVDTIIDLLSDRGTLEQKRQEVIQKSYERFNIQRILQEWDEKVFK